MADKCILIFGDSLSDCGLKSQTGMGGFASVMGLMQVNSIGRFSDGLNWTDALWELLLNRSMYRDARAYGNLYNLSHNQLFQCTQLETLEEKVNKYTETFTANITRFFPANAQGFIDKSERLVYGNFAVGGATGASDYSFSQHIGLSSFAQQIALLGKRLESGTLRNWIRSCEYVLCFIWFGLNDLITAKRASGTMQKVAKAVIDGGGQLTKMLKQAGARDVTCIFGNLPDPVVSPRLLGQRAKIIESESKKARMKLSKEQLAAIGSLDTLQADALSYNIALRQAISSGRERYMLYDASDFFSEVMDDPDDFDLEKGAQKVEMLELVNHPNDVPCSDVDYDIGINRNKMFISDLAHPTEAMHFQIAKNIFQFIQGG